ncbi:MAG: CAP domain-containing protein [Burkholderiales bacterium]|nr:MAG: CAP domain-containing protein [Burkholderiales bacterium]
MTKTRDPVPDRHHGMRRVLAALTIAAIAATGAAGCGGGGDEPAPAGASSLVSAESLAASSASGGGTEAAGDPGAVPGGFEQQVLDAVNAARASARRCGDTAYAPAPSVQWSDSLAQAARGHSEYLQANNVVSHSGASGSSPGDRVSATGYDWSRVGENIAAGFADIDSAIAAWLESPGHCANLMKSDYADIGLAVQPGTGANQFSSYWTMVLAAAR